MATSAPRSVRVKLRPSRALVIALLGEAALGTTDDEAPSVAVPTTLARAGLTEVVRQLWRELHADAAFECPGKLEFRDVKRDALVRGGPLEAYLQRVGAGEEDALVLEYGLPVGAPSELGEGAPVPDWLSSVDAAAADGASSSSTVRVLAASFDGSLVALADEHAAGAGARVVGRYADAHGAPIKAVRVFGPGATRAFTASKDGSIGVWRVDWGDAATLTREGSCVGHTDAVECLDVARSSSSPHDALLCSGGWDGRVRLFEVKLDQSEEGEGAAAAAAAEKKRRAGRLGPTSDKRSREAPPPRLFRPALALEGHTDRVSGVCWGGLAEGGADPVTAFSASWDLTIRMWDVVRELETAALQSVKPATCLDYSHARQLLASGHHDYVVRVWDARASGDSVVKFTLKDHNGWVSHVRFEGRDSPLLASASYDRSVRVWDLRATSRPLFKVENVLAGQIFGVAWGGALASESSGGDAPRPLPARLYLAGSEPRLRTYVLS